MFLNSCKAFFCLPLLLIRINIYFSFSALENSVYCFCCRHFPDNVKTSHEQSFTKTGYRDWKHAAGKSGGFHTHQRSQVHITSAMLWNNYKSMKERGTSVQCMVNDAHTKLVDENRHYLFVLASVLRCTALQQISQRGHLESGSTKKGEGNVREIMRLISMTDETVRKRLETGPRNAKYLHHDIQNEFLSLMAANIKNEIAQEVSKAKYFALIVDESKDISKTEQLSFVLRYVFENVIHEEFLGFCAASKLDAESLVQSILSVLKSHGIDVHSCVAQSYDGAAVMSGNVGGVQARLREIVPSALYIHCYAHRLNLVVVDCVRNIKASGEFFLILQRLYNFISGSAVHQHFKQLQQDNSTGKLLIKAVK